MYQLFFINIIRYPLLSAKLQDLKFSSSGATCLQV
ncbi:MAG: hypothetical protein ACI9SC_002386 [Gammaproteobacteria bacterium]